MGSSQGIIRPSALRMSEQVDEPLEATAIETTIATSTMEAAIPLKSQSLPFMDRPAVLDGTLAGDVGFDPLGFAKSTSELMNYREAEVKHARLAMLAAAGWPLSELFDKKIAAALGMNPLLDGGD